MVEIGNGSVNAASMQPRIRWYWRAYWNESRRPAVPSRFLAWHQGRRLGASGFGGRI